MWKNNMNIGFCLLLIIIIAVGCSNTLLLKEPPDVVGSADGQKIQFIKGSYQWNYAIADAPTPDVLVKSTAAHIIKPNTVLTLKFKSDKPEKVWVGLWEKQNNVELEAKGDIYFLPSEPGLYVLSIWGKWDEQNFASYGALIEVQE